MYVRQILNPGYAAIHAVIPGAKVAGGVTAPRGSSGGVSPVKWIRGMRSARARLDAYAHHPYPSSSRETPFTGGCGHCETITMATLEKLIAEVGRAFGPKRIWLTEYAYQTGAYGVTQQRQAELIGQSGLRAHKAARVDMLIHYLVKDEPQASRFQSGLFNLAGRPKLAALAFPLPIAQAGRSGGKLVLWGQVRPRSGVQTYRVQVRTGGGAWRFSGGNRQDERARVLQHARWRRRRARASGSTRRRTARTAPRSASARQRARSYVQSVLAPPALYGGFASRVAWLVTGLFLCACGIVLFLESELGLPPWDVLHQGLAEQLGISFGAANVIVSVVVLLLVWRLKRQDRAGDAPERDSDRHVRDRPDGDRRRRRTLGASRSASGSR